MLRVREGEPRAGSELGIEALADAEGDRTEMIEQHEGPDRGRIGQHAPQLEAFDALEDARLDHLLDSSGRGGTAGL